MRGKVEIIVGAPREDPVCDGARFNANVTYVTWQDCAREPAKEMQVNSLYLEERRTRALRDYANAPCVHGREIAIPDT